MPKKIFFYILKSENKIGFKNTVEKDDRKLQKQLNRKHFKDNKALQETKLRYCQQLLQKHLNNLRLSPVGPI